MFQSSKAAGLSILSLEWERYSSQKEGSAGYNHFKSWKKFGRKLLKRYSSVKSRKDLHAQNSLKILEGLGNPDNIWLFRGVHQCEPITGQKFPEVLVAEKHSQLPVCRKWLIHEVGVWQCFSMSEFLCKQKHTKSLAIPGFIQVLENNSETFKTLTKANFPSFFQISYAKKKKKNLFLCLTFVRTLKRNWTSTVKKKWLLQEQSSVHTIIIALWSEVGLETARQGQHEESNDFFYIHFSVSGLCVRHSRMRVRYAQLLSRHSVF